MRCSIPFLSLLVSLGQFACQGVPEIGRFASAQDGEETSATREKPRANSEGESPSVPIEWVTRAGDTPNELGEVCAQLFSGAPDGDPMRNWKYALMLAPTGWVACESPLGIDDIPGGAGAGEVPTVPTNEAKPTKEVELVPEADPEQASRAGRFRMELETTIRSSNLALFEGELSDYHLGRVRRDDIPQTLEKRRVLLSTWVDDDGVWAAPKIPLEPGTNYSLTELGHGLLVELTVAEGETLLRRRWPSPETPGSAYYTVYCGVNFPIIDSERVVLAPLSVEARLSPGIDIHGVEAERCVQLRADKPRGVAADELHLPPLIPGLVFDPSPLFFPDVETIAELDCSLDEVALGPACARRFRMIAS